MKRETIKRAAFLFAKPVPFRLMMNLTGQKFIFPFYHAVSDNPGAHIRHLYHVPAISQFRHELEWLLKYFAPATYDDVLKFVKTGKQPEKPCFFLSFDDGLSECHRVIAPVLKEKGIQAAFFINPSFTGNTVLSHRQKISLIIEALENSNGKLSEAASRIFGFPVNDKVKNIEFIRKLKYQDMHVIDNLLVAFGIDIGQILGQKPYMETKEIIELSQAGHIIGSHSMDHREFFEISEDEMERQIINSFQFIENQFGEPRKAFSFPFTDDGVPLSFFRFLARYGVEVSFGTAGLKEDSFPGHIQRIPMDDIKYRNGVMVLRTEYSYYIVKAFLGKNILRRK